MADQQEILSGLAEIVNEVAGVPVDNVQLDKSFTDDLDIDSLSMVEVVVAAEEKFGVKIPDDDVKDLRTVGDAVSYIAAGGCLTDDQLLQSRQLRPSSLPGSAPPRRSAATSRRLGKACWLVAPASALSPRVGVGVAGARLRHRQRSTQKTCSTESRPASSTAHSNSRSSPRARHGQTPGSPEVDPERLGVSIATGIGGALTLLGQWDVLRESGPRRVSPHTIPMLMPNGPAAIVGLELSARAGVHTPVSACASGAEAVAQGLQMIRSGRADMVVVGGTEACIHPLPLAAFAAMRALSKRNDDPPAASRPYDTERDGFVFGEGAAVLVLETAEQAQRLAARTIYAEVAGCRHHRRRSPHRAARTRGHAAPARAMAACH